ncbi:MAG: ATP phosphoribosyltransferase regulatory subunit, partial [Oscillospiraceae bacterium]
IFNTLIDSLNIEDELKEQIRVCIESKNYPSLNDMLDKIGNYYEVSVLKQLPRLFGEEEVFDKALAIIKDEKTISILNYLKEIYQKLKKITTEGKITVDFGVVNRTDYYTGVVFKGYIEGYFGEALLSGGRYDNLMSGFLKDSGAIGFAVNVDAAAKALIHERGETQNVDIIVFCKDGYEIEAFEHTKIISTGHIVEFSLFDTLDETIEYATTKGISRVDVVCDSVRTIEL